jgi:hypothetical protein
MPILATCPCGKKYQLKDEFAGRRAKCPACGRVFQIPGRQSAAGTAAVPPESEGAPPVSRMGRTAVFVGLSATALVMLVGLGFIAYLAFLKPSKQYSAAQAPAVTPQPKATPATHSGTQEEGAAPAPRPSEAPAPQATATPAGPAAPSTAARTPAEGRVRPPKGPEQTLPEPSVSRREPTQALGGLEASAVSQVPEQVPIVRTVPRFTAPPLECSSPSWSPDGKEIMFVGRTLGQQGSGVCPGNIWIASADGSKRRMITNFFFGKT